MTPTRFGALRFIVGLQVLCGSLLVVCSFVMVLAVAGGELGMPELRKFLGSPLGVGLTIAVFLIGITWIAFAQLIQVILQIEVNTRKESKDAEKAS
jgi:hypothetical protein